MTICDLVESLLIIKLGAAGDVVRTTSVLNHFSHAKVDWLTDKGCRELIPDCVNVTVAEDAEKLKGRAYDLVLQLEDDLQQVRRVLSLISYHRLIGAKPSPDERSLVYGPELEAWLDMSLISRYGRVQADKMKLENRDSYQHHLYRALGLEFQGEPYILPQLCCFADSLKGDIAFAIEAGSRWPMKQWGYYQDCIKAVSEKY